MERNFFDAHPWLNGPGDSYLGFWERGGGASGEHSHALNLWQYFVEQFSLGKVNEINYMLDYKNESNLNYDKICSINLKTDKNFIGRVVQDVITLPVRKKAIIQGLNGKIEWICHYSNHNDKINRFDKSGSLIDTIMINKDRSDDFLLELLHIENSIVKNLKSPLDLNYGIETMKILEKMHTKSNL